MLRSVRCTMLAALVGWLAVISPAAAITPEVRDEANFFKPETIKKANEEIKEIKHRYHRDLVIETFKTVPAGKEQEAKSTDQAVRERFFSEWALKRARDQEVSGIYVLVARDPSYLKVVVGNETRKKAFTEKNRDRLADILRAKFKEQQFDKGLLEGIDYVRQTLRENLASAEISAPVSPRTNAPLSPQRAAAPSVSPLWGWLCIGVVVFLAIWLVAGLIRAFTGGAGGGSGYGPGGGFGGGGGFFTGLLGGLFGAAAGSWLYDHYFRGDGGHAGGWGASQASGSDLGSNRDSGEDTDYTASSGGDFSDGGGGGDSGGGGDFGGGGGDFGGGGGDFGGGDFGGGGGDY